MKRKYIAVIMIVVVAALLSGGMWMTKRTLHALQSGSQTAQAARKKRTAPVDTVTLDATMASILQANANLDISISITDLNTGKGYHYGDSANYAAASITKLLTATMFLHTVENGSASLDEMLGDDTAAHHLERMIVESDNDSWEALNASLTNVGLQAYAQSLGLTSYDAETNQVNSNDIARLLTRLYHGQLLNDTHTQLLLSYMARANQTGYIVAAAPSNAQVYHKAGWLEDRLHDAAIVDDGSHAYVLVIFSKSFDDTYDYDNARSFFAAITQAASQAFLESAAK